ncbi:hypothetical protein SAMN00777080_2309 [Aquiflexum balticum DSM 16537]|uniref:Lipocalin-like domain-containing protein n=1 Tax=Aquiflexum balticum DSM 16537 TaxID=758820 RepID=A0A1W2H500_9BACT|nr:hypothetical protein [Aquiflexum balticum]SMD43702.1 hypothetical protein SAMN00777080_2309 [Aquiflexum balticum DSM 16537]
MKKLILTIIIAGLVPFIFSSCGDNEGDTEPQKTPEELAIEDLTGGSSLTWVIAGGGSVIRDGRSETNIYQDFELTLTASSKPYSSINSNELFDANGNWSFVGTNLDKITLSGSKPASEREISFTRTGNDLRLVFSITVPGAEAFPSGAVAGNYTFNLKKK